MITELQKRKRRLQAQIAEAFDAVPYPSDDNLYDGWQLDDDYEDVVRRFTGRHWRDLLPKRKPRKGRTTHLAKDMVFCSAAAWRFFLPAHLITEITRENISPFDFEPGLPGRMGDHIERRFSRLNAKQCAAVVSYLEYAGALLNEKQKNKPQYSRHYEWEHRRLEPVAAYWSSRLKAL